MKRRVLICIGRILATTAIGLSNVWAADAGKPLPKPDGKPAEMSKPVQVFILMGQSNMLGFGATAGGKEGTLDFACKDKKLYPFLVDDAGNWTERKDVRNVRVMVGKGGGMQVFNNEWMTINGSIGPEIGIGHHLGNAIDAPVLILKSCIGNRSLGWDLLPPGTKPYDGQPGYRGSEPYTRDVPKPAEWYAGKQYDDDVENAKKVLAELDKYYPGAKKYEVVGFCWWQGDKDMRNEAHANNYEKNFENLMVELRKDFDAPKAKFVAASLGQTKKGSKGGDGKILDALESISKKKPTEVGFVYANPLSKGGSSSGHYDKNAETYMNVGLAMGEEMVKLLKAGGGSAQPAAGPARPASGASTSSRAARTLSPERLTTLNSSLLDTLVNLSNDGMLKPLPIGLSVTRARVSLKKAGSDGTLTFQIVGGTQTADFKWSDIATVDRATLSQLVAALKPESSDAQAMAGVYMESIGKTKEADDLFTKAGEESRKKLEKLFD